MKDFLEYLVKSIVKNEDDVKIDELDENGYTNLKISVNQEDIGMVIGKEGKVIKSLRNLVKAKAIRENKRVNVEIVE